MKTTALCLGVNSRLEPCMGTYWWRVGRRGLLNVNFDSGLRKTFPRTHSSDSSELIFKVACAWPGSPQPFRQMFCVRTHCWPSTCWNNCSLGNWGAALGVQQQKRHWATLSGVARRNETSSFTCAYLRQSLTPTSMVQILTVLKYLQLYFTSWSLPWIYQWEEWILPHLDAKGHQTPCGTYVFVCFIKGLCQSELERQLGEV